jgi:hypothetical protein
MEVGRVVRSLIVGVTRALVLKACGADTGMVRSRFDCISAQCFRSILSAGTTSSRAALAEDALRFASATATP